MVSRENTVILASLVVAVVAWYLVETYAGGPFWLSYAVLVVLGIGLPTVVNGYMVRQGSR